MFNGEANEMSIPITKEELDKAARRAVKRIINRKKELTSAEMEAQGIPSGLNGRPLRGARLREYMEFGYVSWPRKRK